MITGLTCSQIDEADEKAGQTHLNFPANGAGSHCPIRFKAGDVVADFALGFARGRTAFSILVFTESMQQGGFFLKKKPPCIHS
jgi:hypothetical protein